MSLVGSSSNQRRRRQALKKGKQWLKWLCTPQVARLFIAVVRIVDWLIRAIDERN